MVPAAEGDDSARIEVFVKDSPAIQRIKRILRQGHGAGGGGGPGVNHRGLNQVEFLVAARQVTAAFIIVQFKIRDFVEARIP